MDDAQPWIVRTQPFENLSRAVVGAIVDDDEFEIHAALCERPSNALLDPVAFVPRGNHDGDTWYRVRIG